MPEAHIHDGTAWRKATQLHVHDGTAWRSVREGHVHDGTAWRQFFTAWTAVSDTIAAYAIDPDDATAEIQYNADGTTSSSDGARTNWYGSTGAGTGTGKYVRATLSSGATPTGTLNAWLELTAARAWSLTRIVAGVSSCVLTIEFSSNGSTVDHTVSITLHAEVNV